MAKITFESKSSPFYSSMKENVAAYFVEKGIKQTGNVYLYVKLLTLIPAAIIIYFSLLFIKMDPIYAVILCAMEGLVFSFIGFNVMHDACHGSFSSKKWVNTFLGYSLNALGGNAFIWKQKHNVVHHTYTNVDGIDDDIAKLPVIRQCDSQQWNKMHRFQHIYMFLIYGLSSFLWVGMMDFAKYFTKKIYKTDLQKMELNDHLIFWISKILYVVFYVALPIYFVGFLPWLAGFFIMHLFMGLSLALVFQLAHVVENTEFIDGNVIVKSEDEWAVHQVKTTSNFAVNNKVVSWFVGGLNFQVEHHLFPRVSHVHYPAISKIVKANCDKYNVPYNQYPTLTSALASHIRFMKFLGEK